MGFPGRRRMGSRREDLIRKIQERLEEPEEHIIFVVSTARPSYRDMRNYQRVAKRHVGLRCRFLPFRQKEPKEGTIVGVVWDRRKQKIFYRIRPDGQTKTITKLLFSKDLEIWHE